MSEGLVVLPFRHGPFWNFTYLLACPQTGEAAVVDPAWDIASVVDMADARGFRISTLLLTHAHSDHAHGTEDLVRRTGAAVIAHTAELPELRRLYRGAITEVAGDESMQIGAVSLRLLHTPGHSEGSISILADGQIFTGDTLAVGSVGRPGPGDEALEALWNTVNGVLRQLPDETVVRPGHDSGPSPSSPLGEQRVLVPALAATSLADFAAEIQRGAGWHFPA
ncbi:MAG TPA: MBL fold metallo-hydrolase [Tepidiformaceae bacterium]